MDVLPTLAHAHHPDATARSSKASRSVLYCRAPGLLALAARQRQSPQQASPIVISEGRTVRDTCALALAQGVTVGASVVQARRLCPTLLAVPLETVDASARRRQFLDALADISPVVEPDGLDVAYVDMMGGSAEAAVVGLRARLLATSSLPLVIGLGVSRLAARACAESGVKHLDAASVDWLWDDPAIVGRLQRLGLGTFGQVAEVGEEALRLHFGKIAPVLHRRAQGIDLTPIRALYPPPKAEATVDCSEAPVDDHVRLREVLVRASLEAASQLREMGGSGRRVSLEITTERGVTQQQWVVPAPVQSAADIARSAGRILSVSRLSAPVTCLSIAVDEVGVPDAHTPDLFGVQSDAVAMEAVKRRLAARFGLTTLTFLGKRQRSTREKRQAAVRERDEMQRKMLL